MQLFNDYWENTYSEIRTWYPIYYLDVYEMQEVLKAEGALIDDLKKAIQKVFDNCFIDQMDEAHIAMLEDWLGIRFARQRTLSERRAALKAMFAGHGHISASLLKSIVQSYTNSEVEIYFEPIVRTPGAQYYEPGNNKLYINWLRGDAEIIYTQDIENLLSRMIPAHIAWQSAMTYRFKVAVSTKRKKYTKDFDFCGTYPEISTLGRSHEAEVDVDTSTGILNSKSIVHTFRFCGAAVCQDSPL